MPKHLESIEVQLSIDRAFILPIDSIEKYSKACQILLNERTSLENIEIIVKDLINIDKISYQDPIFLIKLIIRCCRNDNYLIDSFIFQSIIIPISHTVDCLIHVSVGDPMLELQKPHHFLLRTESIIILSYYLFTYY